MGRPVGSVIRSDSPDPSVFEQGALLDHVKLASDSPLAFTELLSFPWIRDFVTYFEWKAITSLGAIAYRDSAAAR